MTTKMNLAKKVVDALIMGALIGTALVYGSSCTKKPTYQTMWVDPVDHRKEADWYKINR